MSLKIVRRKGTEALYVRGSIGGQRIFESTGTADPARAEEYRGNREGELWKQSVYGKKATVTFAHAVHSYLVASPPTPTTARHVRKLLKHFSTTKLQEIDQEALDVAYRKLLTTKAGNATKLRSVLTPLRAILEDAAIRKWCDRPAFETPAQSKPVTRFLRPAELVALVQAAAPHLKPLLVFLAGTGARMSEALDLTWRDVDLMGARAVLWQKQGTERHVDLPAVVLAALSALPDREGHVFRPVRHRRPLGQAQGKTRGTRYADTKRTGGGQIKAGWAIACKNAGLPGRWREWTPKGHDKVKRQFVPDLTPHCLRHTWASWHYCLHRDLIALQHEGGWSTITMVTRYAKKMPAAYRPEIEAWLAGRATKLVHDETAPVKSVG